MVDRVFETSRFLCTPVQQSDSNFVRSLYQSSSRMAHLGGVFSQQNAQALFEKMLDANTKVFSSESSSESSSGYWLIVNKNTDDKMGVQGISAVTSLLATAEVGIILNEQAEGKGTPFEVLSAMFSYVFSSLGVELLIERHVISNKAIGRVSRRLGFNHTVAVKYNDTPSELSVLEKKDWLKQSYCQ